MKFLLTLLITIGCCFAQNTQAQTCPATSSVPCTANLQNNSELILNQIFKVDSAHYGVPPFSGHCPATSSVPCTGYLINNIELLLNAIYKVDSAAAGGGGSGGTVTAVTGVNSVTATPNPIVGAGTIQLVNDASTPGNSKYYGTNTSGTKGFFALPAATPRDTFNNGITRTVDTVQLGGSLIKNTTINATANFQLTVTGSKAGSNGANSPLVLTNTNSSGSSTAVKATSSGNSTDSYGVYGVSVNGSGIFGTGFYGVQGVGTQGGVLGITTVGTAGVTGSSLSTNPLIFGGVMTKFNTNTNVIDPILQIQKTTSGTPANGIGGSLDYFIQNVTGNGANLASRLSTQWTDATNATRTSRFEISLYNNATFARKFAIQGTGQQIWDAYASGAFTGTALYSVQIDAAGNVITGAVAASAPVYAALQIPYGNGSTPGGVTDADFNRSTSGLNVNQGSSNLFIGAANSAGNASVIGSGNTAVGDNALTNIVGGVDNVAMGNAAMANTIGGADNVGIGVQALNTNIAGSGNVAIGAIALTGVNTGGTNLTCVGIGANVSADGLDNSTALGNGAIVDSSNKVVVGNTAITSYVLAGFAGGGTTMSGIDNNGRVFRTNGIATSLPHVVWTNQFSSNTDTLFSNTYNIYASSGTVSSLTIVFPDNPQENDVIEFKFSSQNAPTLGITYMPGLGGAIIDNSYPAAPPVGLYQIWHYDLATNTWW